MKLVWQPIPVVLVLCVGAILVMKTSSPSFSQHRNGEFSFSPLLLFLVFNTLIVAIIVGSHKWPVNEDGRGMPLSCSFYGVGSAYDAYTIVEENYEEEDDEDDEDEGDGDGDGCSSDGYYEDDDDNASDDDDDDNDWDECRDEYDENLERRIEDFIAKVTDRWREERSMEDRRKARKVIGKEFTVSS